MMGTGRLKIKATQEVHDAQNNIKCRRSIRPSKAHTMMAHTMSESAVQEDHKNVILMMRPDLRCPQKVPVSLQAPSCAFAVPLDAPFRAPR